MNKNNIKSEVNDGVVYAQGSQQQESESEAAKRIRIVADFLKRFGPFEIVAVKALYETVANGSSADELEPACLKSINYCLNAGAFKETVASPDEMVDHRMANAQELLDKVEKYFTPKAYTRIAMFIMPIASNSKMKNEAFENLKPMPAQPADSKPRKGAEAASKQG